METRWTHHTSATFPELREASSGVCVIPIGCIEKHGLHMALGTDIMIATKVCHMATQIETATLFPDYTFGEVALRDNEHTEGTVSLPVDTHFIVLEQLCDEIYKNGFRKILLFNGHGGNVSWITSFIRRMSVKNKKYAVANFYIDLQAPHLMAKYLLEHGKGSIPELTDEDEELILKCHKENMLIDHACFGEGAYMMGIAPETMRLDLLGRESGLPTGASKGYKEAGLEIICNGWLLDYPHAFCGHDPYGINERIGAAALRMEAERFAKAIKFFKEDTKLLELIDKK